MGWAAWVEFSKQTRTSFTYLIRLLPESLPGIMTAEGCSYKLISVTYQVSVYVILYLHAVDTFVVLRRRGISY